MFQENGLVENPNKMRCKQNDKKNAVLFFQNMQAKNSLKNWPHAIWCKKNTRRQFCSNVVYHFL